MIHGFKKEVHRLIKLRKRMGVSQAKMAELLGYKSGIRISEIESGKKVMSGQALKCLEYLEIIWDQDSLLKESSLF